MNRDAVLQALASDPSGASVGLVRRALPAGHVVDVPGVGPLYWVSDGVPTAQDLAWARAGFVVSGLWPLLVDGGGAGSISELGPDGRRERTCYWLGEGHPSDLAGIDPDQWMAADWTRLIAQDERSGYVEPAERVSGLAPAGTAWPGPAPQADWIGTPDNYADAMTEFLLEHQYFEHPRMGAHRLRAPRVRAGQRVLDLRLVSRVHRQPHQDKFVDVLVGLEAQHARRVGRARQIARISPARTRRRPHTWPQR